AALVRAEALAHLIDLLEPGREQPLHLVFGRGDQVPASRGDRVEVDLEPGARHEQRGLDLEEAARGEDLAHGGEGLGPGAELVEAGARQPHDLAAGRGVIAAGVPAHDRFGVDIDDVARTPGLRRVRDAQVELIRAHDRGVPVDRDDAAARRHYLFTRSTYSCVRVSILIVSPTLMNSGTAIVAPVSTVAGFVTLPVVSPLTPGSDAVTSRNTNVGSVTASGRSLKHTTVHGRVSI